MSSKYRMTGCARLFLFLLILVPIAFFAASYITGNDPVQAIKTVFNNAKESENMISKNEAYIPGKKNIQKLLEEKNDEIERLKNELQRVTQELEQIKSDLQKKQNSATKDGN